MLSEDIRTGTYVRVTEDAQGDKTGMVGTVTQVYGDPDYVAAEVTFDDGAAVLYWHYQIDPVEQQA